LTTYQRRQKLLELIRLEPGLRVPELADRLKVSEGTIRNDFNALSLAGQIMRVRGGAAIVDSNSPSSPAFTTRVNTSSERKDIIARAASHQVRDGESILLDASSTVYAMARYLQDRRGLRVVTNGIEVARLLAAKLSNTVILLGGVIKPDGSSITGSLSERFLRDLHINTAFVSCSGFTLHAGLTEVDIHEAQLKEIAIRSAQSVIALIDSSKFGRTDLTPFARLDQISHLYTDSDLSQDWQNSLALAGLPFTLCLSDRR
jgi:DeoR/GlpR family transcriptional regulator of sugar metabolism